MSKFDQLIHNLKKDLQSLPSVDGSVAKCAPIEDVSMYQPPTQSDVIGTVSTKRDYKKWFVQHGLLSAEFFLFFFIFLAVCKPSFLYYNERVIRNGRELLRTHFSVKYLFGYSILFTGLFHLLIFIHKDLSKRY